MTGTQTAIFRQPLSLVHVHAHAQYMTTCATKFVIMRITITDGLNPLFSYIDDLMVVGGDMDMAICVVLIYNVQHYDGH